MLAIEVSFLTGRYIATAHDRRDAPEWPPHPARLYSALVATYFGDEPASPGERAALLWLESLPPPAIRASEADWREPCTAFVPVNDTAVVPDLTASGATVDDLARSLDAMRAALTAGDLPAPEHKALDKQRAQAEKNLAKARQKLEAAIRKAVAAPASHATAAIKEARELLPEHRGRQPRPFPSVTPREPCVTFIWSDAEPTDRLRSDLDGLLAKLVRLGHSSSLVSARLVDGDVTPTLMPGTSGDRKLRVVRSGQMDALERAFARHQATESRVIPAAFQSYVPEGGTVREIATTSVFTDEWLVLRRCDGPQLPAAACVQLAKTVRKALMSHCPDPIPAFLSGHRVDGSPSGENHLAIAPLPFVGSSHATGAILGVALVFPRSMSGGDRAAIARALEAWERTPSGASGQGRVMALRLGRLGLWTIERVDDVDPRLNLQPETWCAPSRSWVTATPIALDRHPGALSGHDPARVRAAIEQATDVIKTACVRIGLPPPTSIEVLPSPPLPGAPSVREMPLFAPGNFRRCLVHARIDFDDPVTGPVLLGAGRYHGLGLLRPVGGA